MAEQGLIKFMNPHSEDLSVHTPKFDGIGEPSSSALTAFTHHTYTYIS